MLNIGTLFMVCAVNFLAVCMVWGYVARSYPNLHAARYWTVAACIATLGTSASVLRVAVDVPPWVVTVVGGCLLLCSTAVATIGVDRFYDRPLRWRLQFGLVAAATAGLALCTFWYDSIALRMVIYSIAQSISLGLTIPMMSAHRDENNNAGARLTVFLAMTVIAVHAVRSLVAVLDAGGAMTFANLNNFQVIMVLMLVFLAMAWNFGFLLMAIDRLRGEVAELALLDDLTGVANRRRFVQHLTEDCALAQRTQKPFALLAIDLDGFKEVNDGHGHAAGDDCLRHFTLMTQSKLRPGDLLARTGGDEFCIILPSTTLSEAAGIAKRILDACRADAAACLPGEVRIAASIGVAQWLPQVGQYPERLIAAADRALYAAKNGGKNRYAVDATDGPSMVPDMDAVIDHIRARSA